MSLVKRMSVLLACAIMSLPATYAQAQRESGREPAGVNREPAGFSSAERGRGNERAGSDRSGGKANPGSVAE